MVNSIENTLADGFDPAALDKLDLDTQERLSSLSQPLYAGSNQESMFAPIAPFVPKDLDTADFLFKSRNNVKLSDLMESDDPEKLKAGWDYINNKAINSDAVKYGLTDYVYKTNPTIEKLKSKGYGYNIKKSAVQNEDEAYNIEKDSHWWVTNAVSALGKGLARLPGQVLIKGFSIGAKAAAIFDNIVYENDDRDLLTSIGDNVFVRYFQDLDEKYKKEFLPSLQSSEYAKAGFFKKMSYSQFWTDEAVDFTAYMLASRGLGGLVTKSLSGLPGVAGKIATVSAGGKAGKFLEFVTGSRNIAGVSAYAANILNEATDESLNQYKKIKEDLVGMTNPDTENVYTFDEIQERASKAAAFTFKGNAAILALSGGLENRWIQRAVGKEALQKGLKDITIDNSLKAIEKEFSNKLLQKVAKNGIGKRVLYYGPEVVEGLFKEGYWEENAQTAMTRLADMKFGVGYYERISDDGIFKERTNISGNSFTNFFRQLGKQTRDASTWLGGKGDNEVSTAIGIGGLIATSGTAISNKVALKSRYDEDADKARLAINNVMKNASEEEKVELQKQYDKLPPAYKFKVFKSERKDEENARIKRINEINNARENLLSFKDIFREDGTIDKEMLMAKTAAMADLETRLDASDDVENPVIKKDIQERLFSELMLAHFNNGTYDQFKSKFGERSEEELALLGFSKELIGDPKKLVEFGDQLEEQYKKIKNLEFGNSLNLKSEQFEAFDSLLKSRIYQLQANSIVNQNTIDRMNTYMDETFGDTFGTAVRYDMLEKTLTNLKLQKDEDGSLQTQKEIIEDELKAMEADITTQMDELKEKNGEEMGDKFVGGINAFENAKKYQEKINTELGQYLNDISKSIEVFREQYQLTKESLAAEELAEPVTKEEVPVVDPITGVVPPTPPAETTGTETPEGEEKPPAGTPLPDAEEERKRQNAINTRALRVTKLGTLNTKEELDAYFNKLSEAIRTDLADEYAKRLDEIENSNVEEDALSEDEEVLTEFPDSSIPYETILKTSSRDSENRNNNYEEDLIDNEYNIFRNSFLSSTDIRVDLEENGYYFVMEQDNFVSGNISNLSEEEFNKNRGVALVLKKEDGTNASVSDIFPSEFQSIANKNVQFYVDNDFLNLSEKDKDELYRTKADIRLDRKGIPVDSTLEEYKNQEEQLKKAIAIVKKGGSIKVKANVIKKPKIVSKNDKTKKLNYRKVEGVKQVFIDTGTTQARVIFGDNDFEVNAYPSSVNTSPDLFLKVREALSKEFETEADAKKVRTEFLNLVFLNTKERYFDIQEKNGKFVLVPTVVINKVKQEDADVINGSRPINVSRKALAGQMIIDGNPISKEAYIEFIKGSFRTAEKIIYNPDGTQYTGKLSSYFEYEFADNQIVNLLEQKLKRGEEFLKKLKDKVKSKTLTPAASLYVDQLGNFLSRVTSMKKSPDKIFGTEAANRGTLIDNLLRDFLSGKELDKEEFAKMFNKELLGIKNKFLPVPEFTSDFINSLYDAFTKFKNHNPNLTYITDIPALFGKIQGRDFAGTIDILARDNRNGDLFIIDLKSSNKSRADAYKNENSDYSIGDKLQLNAYAELVKQMTGQEVKGLYTFPLILRELADIDSKVKKSFGFYDPKTFARVDTESTDDVLLLKVDKVDINSLVTLTKEEPVSKYNYKFKGDIIINGVTIPTGKSYAAYATIDNVIKDYLVKIYRYNEDFVTDPPTKNIIFYLGSRGIKFSEKQDMDKIISYIASLTDYTREDADSDNPLIQLRSKYSNKVKLYKNSGSSDFDAKAKAWKEFRNEDKEKSLALFYMDTDKIEIAQAMAKAKSIIATKPDFNPFLKPTEEDINPDFESIHRELNPKFDAKEQLKQERELKKKTLKAQIDALSDDYVYLSHITNSGTAKNIFETQFQYNLGTSLNGTFGVGVSKDTLYKVMSDLIDGNSPHRGYLSMFIVAIPKSDLTTYDAGRRINSDMIEDYFIETYPEMAVGKIPTKYNFGYFEDGVLTTPQRNQEEEKGNESSEPSTNKIEPTKEQLETNDKYLKLQEQIDKINDKEYDYDAIELEAKVLKDIKLPKNIRFYRWALQELVNNEWVYKPNVTTTNADAFFSKDTWIKIQEAKKEYDRIFTSISKDNTVKTNKIEQKQRDFLSDEAGLELRRAWSFGLIEEDNIIGINSKNAIELDFEIIDDKIIDKDTYKGYYYLPNTKFDEDWYDEIIGATKKEVEDKINARYNAELEKLKSIVPNPVEKAKAENKRNRVAPGSKIRAKQASFIIDGNNVIFNEKTGEITVNGSPMIVPREVLAELHENYKDNQVGVQILKSIIRTKNGDIEVYSKKYPDDYKDSKVTNSYIFDKNGRLLGDLTDLTEDGSMISLTKEDFLDDGSTREDILKALNINC